MVFASRGLARWRSGVRAVRASAWRTCGPSRLDRYSPSPLSRATAAGRSRTPGPSAGGYKKNVWLEDAAMPSLIRGTLGRKPSEHE
jgi:hypothetical protein